MLLRNDLKPVQIEGVELTIDSFEEPRTTTIERVVDGRREPKAGDTVPRAHPDAQVSRRRAHADRGAADSGERARHGVDRRLGRHAPRADRAARLPPAARGRERRSDDSRLQPRAPQQPASTCKLVASAPGAVVNGEQLSALPPSVLAVIEADQPGGNVLPLSSAVLGEWELSADHAVTGQRTLAVAAHETPSVRRLASHPTRVAAPTSRLRCPSCASRRSAPHDAVSLPRRLRRRRPRRLDAASTSFWLVSTQAEFLKGEVEQALDRQRRPRDRSAPRVDTVHDVDSPAVWRLLVDGDDTLWAGTGNDGKVWKVDARRQGVGRLRRRRARDSRARAGAVRRRVTRPRRRTARSTRSRTTAGDARSSIPKTNTSGACCRRRTARSTSAPAKRAASTRSTRRQGHASSTTPETTHVTALAWDPRGALLVGTSSPGRVVRIDPSGTASCCSSRPTRRFAGCASRPTADLRHRGRRRRSGGARRTPVEEPSPTTTDVGADPDRVDRDHGLGDWRQTIVTPSTSGLRQRTAPRDREGRGLSHRAGRRVDDRLGIARRYAVRRRRRAVGLAARRDRRARARSIGSPAIRRSSTLVTRADAQQVTGFAAGRDGPSAPRHVESWSHSARDRGHADQGHLSLRREGHGDGRHVGRDSLARGDAGGHGGRAVHAKREHEDAGQDVERLVEGVHERGRRAIESPKARYLQWRAVLTAQRAGRARC